MINIAFLKNNYMLESKNYNNSIIEFPFVWVPEF